MPASPPRVNLVVMNPNKFGGTVTYTAHLSYALRAAGAATAIYRLGARLGKPAAFGYGCVWRAAPLEYLTRLPGDTLITAYIGKEYEGPVLELLASGAFVTVHDPNDLGRFQDTSWALGPRVIIGRPNNASICPNATYVPYPFVRQHAGFAFSQPRPWHAVTLSRLGAIKRTKWVVEANRRLPPDYQIWLRGYDDRFFTYNAFVRGGKYPEFRQDSELPEGERRTFAKEMGEAQRIASMATYLVDLTEIKGDGGGVQYALLEGIDAGCVPVLNRAWATPGGIWRQGVNCLTVGDADELVDCLSTTRSEGMLRSVAACAYKLLVHHEPAAVGRRYLELFARNRETAAAATRQ